ncbi:MAG: hypothetical protein KDI51_17545, partial [Xanthomonadales bacterium]|nr:hypothetical protein [Xanthomonadales bacterium]
SARASGSGAASADVVAPARRLNRNALASRHGKGLRMDMISRLEYESFLFAFEAKSSADRKNRSIPNCFSHVEWTAEASVLHDR